MTTTQGTDIDGWWKILEPVPSYGCRYQQGCRSRQGCIDMRRCLAPAHNPKFAIGQRVRKIKGSSWQGRVVGFYSTALTPTGYAVESEREPGSVQIYPENALEPV